MTTRLFLSRRSLLAVAAASVPAMTRAANSADVFQAEFRGALNGEEFGVHANANDPQNNAFQKMLESAASRNMPVFLPPGRYEISNIRLPTDVRLSGVKGATVLVYSGDGQLFNAEQTRRFELSNLTIDGANRWLSEDQPGLLTLRNIERLSVENCEILGAAGFGVWAERCSGSLSRNEISGARDSAIYAVESKSMDIRDNNIFDCGNGGILVHRWTKGEDGTIVSGNRISRIKALDGGTGQNGNGINVFRADGVMISNNSVSDCAFSAIRSNAGSNVQISGNQCLRSGEMAIYSEFGFEGAIISSNMIDGAANGIAVVNFSEGGRLAVINGNIVRNLTLKAPYSMDGQYFGIGISAEAEAAISGNVVENSPLWGIQVGWGPYVRNVNVTGNIVRKAPVGCAVSVVEGAGPVLIQANRFSDTPVAAVAGFHWADKVTGELASNETTSSGNLTLSANSVS